MKVNAHLCGVKRAERDRLTQEIREGTRVFGNGVYVSEVSGVYLVWTLTPRCEFLRVLSTWDRFESACDSAHRARCVKARAKQRAAING